MYSGNLTGVPKGNVLTAERLSKLDDHVNDIQQAVGNKDPAGGVKTKIRVQVYYYHRDKCVVCALN